MAAAAIKRGLYNPCQLCHSKIDDTRNRRNLGVRTAECATASVDSLCCELGLSRAEIVPGPVCKKCFQDLEKLTKAQTTVSLLRARFLGCLRSRITRVLPPVMQSASSAQPERTVQRKRTSSSDDVSSPIATSTPSSHPPLRKRPLLVRETPKARKSLQFSDHGSDLLQNREEAVLASPLVSVVSYKVTDSGYYCAV